MSSRKLDARPEADAGGPRLRTMERRWLSELQTHSFGRSLISMLIRADGSERHNVRVLMIVVRALPSEPRRALTNEKGICGADETFSVIRDLSSSNV